MPLTEISHSLADWAAHYGGAAFLPLMFVSGIGVPLIPAETLLLGGALLAAKGDISFPAMLICAWAGSVLGGAAGWGIGRLGGAAVIARIVRLCRIDAGRLAKSERMMRKHGVYFVIAARFIPVARELSGLLSGSLRLGFARFMAGNIIGALLWVSAWAVLPYFLGHAL